MKMTKQLHSICCRKAAKTKFPTLMFEFGTKVNHSESKPCCGMVTVSKSAKDGWRTDTQLMATGESTGFEEFF